MESRSQFMKGCARTLVLNLLEQRAMYGYELAAELTRQSAGIFALGQGTLYPLLYSLESKGLIHVVREDVSQEEGRRRRYYAVTPAGRAELSTNITTWREIARGMQLVLGAQGANGAGNG